MFVAEERGTSCFAIWGADQEERDLIDTLIALGTDAHFWFMGATELEETPIVEPSFTLGVSGVGKDITHLWVKPTICIDELPICRFIRLHANAKLIRFAGTTRREDGRVTALLLRAH